ncbi:hypothetical protein LX36DRAFT_658396 [Colletotrichum falcatum]|nr:hypothetical protein LX36DRAFT_658396 [Colletotrichum falcatum]
MFLNKELYFPGADFMNRETRTRLAATAEPYHAPAFYPTAPDVNPFIPPAGEHSYQERPVWYDQTFDSGCFSDDPVIGDTFLQWGAEDQPQQHQPNVLGMTLEHVKFYQNHDCQSAKTSLLTPSPYCSASSLPAPPRTTASQSSFDYQSPHEAGRNASTKQSITENDVSEPPARLYS